MSVSAEELIQSREHSGSDTDRQVILRYVVRGTADDGPALSKVQDTAPATFDGLERQDIDLRPQYVDTTSGSGCWFADVRYITPEALEQSELRQSIKPPAQEARPDTPQPRMYCVRGMQITTKGALRRFTLDRIDSSTDAVDTQGAINVGGSSINGVNVETPVVLLTFRVTMDVFDYVTHKTQWEDLATTVNTNACLGRQPGELLFLGVTGQEDVISVPNPNNAEEAGWVYVFVGEFRYGVAPNRTQGEVFGDPSFATEGGANIEGWDYGWIMYEDLNENSGENFTLPAFKSSYVDRVYPRAEFEGGVEDPCSLSLSPSDIWSS